MIDRSQPRHSFTLGGHTERATRHDKYINIMTIRELRHALELAQVEEIQKRNSNEAEAALYRVHLAASLLDNALLKIGSAL